MRSSADPAAPDDPRPRVGFSPCLLGEPVRYDGGHRRDAFAGGVLAPWSDAVALCPEVELGLGVPREIVQIVRARGGTLRLVAPASGRDHTRAMRRLAVARSRELRRQGIDGWVFKRGSPSCGLWDVPVVGGRGGRGFFAAALTAASPSLPVEEESRLGDPDLRDSFISRLFVHHRLRITVGLRASRRRLQQFHTDQRLLLDAHRPGSHADLGRWLQASEPSAGLRSRYLQGLMTALSGRATPARHVAVMNRILRALRAALPSPALVDARALIAAYGMGRLPWFVAWSTLAHLARCYGDDALNRQSYLRRGGPELAMRGRA